MKLLHYKFILAILTALSAGLMVKAQTQEMKVIPPSPTAASIVKVADYPVNYYSGTLNINIPVYSFKEGDINLPIALSYNTGGVRVSEIPGWIGSGWSLSAGGVISRTVIGLPDDAEKGFFNQMTALKHFNDTLTNENRMSYRILESAESDLVDIQPDVFSFSVGGYSGKIYFDTDGNAKISPAQPIQVSKTMGTTTNHGTIYYIDSWTLTTPDGMVYTFSAKEWSIGAIRNHVSSWYLSHLGSPNNNYVDLEYSSAGTSLRYQESLSEKMGQALMYDSNTTIYNEDLSQTPQRIMSTDETIYLNRIYSPNQEVSFAHSNRNDLIITPPGYTGSPSYTEHKLDNIYIKNYLGDTLKRFWFQYYEDPNYRLQLTSLKEYNDGPDTLRHIFTYHGALGEPFNSKNIDHWGYWNGATNSTLIPETQVSIPGWANAIWGSADREPKTGFAKVGSLQQITYPTGGSTTFEYEGNTYSHVISDIPKPKINKRTYRAVSEYNTNGLNPRTSVDTRDTVSFTLTHQAKVKVVWAKGSDDDYPPCNSVNSEGSFFTNMSPGTYDVLNTFESAVANTSNSCLNRVDLQITLYDTIQPVNVQGGGLRIKKITTSDGVNTARDMIKTYSYTMPADTISSGIVQNEPNYYYEYLNLFGGASDVISSLFMLQSSPVMPASYTKGNTVGYKYVDEVLSNGAKTSYQFTSFQEYPDVVGAFQFPAVHNMGPASSYDDCRGLLKRVKKYDTAGNLMQASSSDYTFSTENYSEDRTYYIQPFTVPDRGLPVFDFVSDYYNRSQWIYKSADTTVTYNNGQPHREVIRYYYETPSHQQLTKMQKEQSDGTVTEIQNRYPVDYTSSGITSEATAMSGLITANNIIPVIETESVQDGNHVKTHSYYKYWSPASVTAPEKISTKLNSNGWDDRVVQYGYTSLGGLLAQSKAGGSTDSYQWGYNNQYPIAECHNAANNEFYTQNYEESGGTAGTAHTGTKHGTSASVSWTRPNSRAYVIDYWYWDGSAWKYKQDNYTSNSYTMTGSSAGYYDDVRIYPADAQITTYTYQPLVGMTSATDAKGQTTWYEYDSFQRLVNIKDQYGNILKHTDYHYQNQ